MKKALIILISFFAAVSFSSSVYAAGFKVSVDDVELDYDNGYIIINGNIGDTNSGSYVTAEITDSDGKTVYIDQLTSTSGGVFGLNVKMTSEYKSGSYTLTVRGTNTDAPAVKTFTFDASRDNFGVKNVTMKKDGAKTEKAYDGDRIEVDFDFFSSFSYDMGGMICAWQLAGTPDGEYLDLHTSDTPEYEINLNEIEKVCNANPEKFSEKKLYLRAAVQAKTVNSDKFCDAVLSESTLEITTLPYVTGISISGNGRTGGTLTGEYTYNDFQGKTEKSSDYEWLRSKNKSSGYTVTGKGISYVVKSSDAGYYFKLRITPRTENGNLAGRSAESEETICINSSQTPSNGGGGGGGGGSSLSRPVTPVAEPTPTAAPDNETNTDKPNVFGDVKEEYWAKADIEKAAERKIVTGDDYGNFNPNANITRAEFSKIILNAIGQNGAVYNNEFEDVFAKDWYAEFIAGCAKLGIVNGSDGKFRPNDVISRQEMAKMLILAYRAGSEETAAAENGMAFADAASISGWALEYVNECAARGFITGMPDGCFAPADNATRAQAAVVANRLYDSLIR